MIRDDHNDRSLAATPVAGIPLRGAGPSVRPRMKPFDNRRVNSPGQSAQVLSAAFWRAWIEHRDYLGQLALRWMSGNRTDAEDLLSRASIKAHDRYLRDAQRIRNLRSWLARLLHNVCMDEHRKRVVRGRMMDRFHPEQLEHLAIQVRSPRVPEEQSDTGEALTKALGAIDAMPRHLREPFVLRFIYQYPNQEIARQMRLTEVNIRKRIQIGRAMVRQSLEDDGNT